jgi:hypothetical protein
MSKLIEEMEGAMGPNEKPQLKQREGLFATGRGIQASTKSWRQAVARASRSRPREDMQEYFALLHQNAACWHSIKHEHDQSKRLHQERHGGHGGNHHWSDGL